jgi:YfiH family protein
VNHNTAVIGARKVSEQSAGLAVPVLVQPEWARELPWLFQGITWRGDAEPFDLGLFGDQPVGRALARWRELLQHTRFPAAVHSRQIHENRIAIHESAAGGLLVMEGADGHVTRLPGLLLAVSVADCLPVYLADESRRAVAILHAGWRGMAAGIVEAGVASLTGLGSDPRDLRVHFGPAICGHCYEVGPEVHQALGLVVPSGPAPVDLVSVAVARAEKAGVRTASISFSGACPKCEPDRFFSHRAGSAGRQMGIIGIRSA